MDQETTKAVVMLGIPVTPAFKQYYQQKAARLQATLPRTKNNRPVGWITLAKRDLEALFTAAWKELTREQRAKLKTVCDIKAVDFEMKETT